MHFPWWYVPCLTAPMLIAVISVVHVLVSHYAVGGGLFLAVETTHAYRTGNRDYLAYLKRHARFFVLLTVVFGAITGVGIWWTIGLASPLATQVLIRTFVFAWATEYVFFVVEIVSAFIFYYYWGRLPQKIHTIIVWIYGAVGLGQPGDHRGHHGLHARPGQLAGGPQLLERDPQPAGPAADHLADRRGAAAQLALRLPARRARRSRTPSCTRLIESRSTRPALLGAVLITLGGLLWHVFLPPSAQAALYAAPVLNVLMALLFAATGDRLRAVVLRPLPQPGLDPLARASPPSCLLFGIIGISTGEFIREAVRKPYIVYNVVLGSQMLARGGSRRSAKTRLSGKRRLDQGLRPGELSAGHVGRRPHRPRSAC